MVKYPVIGLYTSLIVMGQEFLTKISTPRLFDVRELKKTCPSHMLFRACSVPASLVLTVIMRLALDLFILYLICMGLSLVQNVSRFQDIRRSVWSPNPPDYHQKLVCIVI